MDYRVKTSVTVQDCVQAINEMDNYHGVTKPYSAPLVLSYNTKRSSSNMGKPTARSKTTGKSRDTPKSRSRSVLGIRLEYQDYLMSEYIKSKCALISMRSEFQTLGELPAEDYTVPPKQDGKRNGRNTGKLKPVYQNYFGDYEKDSNSTKSSSSRNSSCGGAEDKSSVKSPNSVSSGSGSRHDDRRMNGSWPSGSDTGSRFPSSCEQSLGQTLMFRYTKR